jgi:hypothetical protein
MRARLLVETLLVEMLCIQSLLAILVNQGWSACVNLPASSKATSQFNSNPLVLLVPDVDTAAIEAKTGNVAGTDASLAVDGILVAQGTRPLFRAQAAFRKRRPASGTQYPASRYIQQAVGGFRDEQFQASFAEVAGDLLNRIRLV